MQGSKPTKVPYSPCTGEKASPTAPATWGTYARALSLYDQMRMNGIGYVFSPADPYTGIDLDKCRDPASGIIQPWAHTSSRR